ncbi:MAG TPA: hypothetical protein VGV61_03680 [Thermoanaerobaculia bacterium]|jgi:hypothetical protein|nr:hypothetical protein [Thermoanaerobaculia bacterium]
MRTPLGIVLLLLIAPFAPSRAAEQTPEERAALKGSIVAMREAGTALFTYVTDHAKPAPPEATPAKGESTTSVHWSSCPALSYDQARALVVPTYIAELPRTDGWGNDLQFCFDPERMRPKAHNVIGIRSLGSDRQAEGDEYTVGAFDPEATARDVVWLDGYFVTWPQRK